MDALPEKGAMAPDVSAPDQNGREFSPGDYRGKWLVLYFYPKDSTGGCTLEAREFSELKDRFALLGAVIAGVSRDSVESHKSFEQKQGLSITLISDPGRLLHEAFGAWRMKKIYGRELMGAVRSTFLIAPDGSVAYVWPNVKAAGHAAAVLEKLGELVRPS
ncbi:MAG: peroxiredoxin [Candidatus Fermentibacteraceae bacterium]